MRKTSGARKSIAVLLLAVLLASFIFPLSVSANEVNSGEDFKKVETHYDIAVVFDNSLSMFYDNPNGRYEYIPRWSRAKFAMEIFASMLDIDGGDTLSIFPMWRVDTKERSDLPEADRNDESLKKYRTGINDRVDIKTQKDIDDINRLFTISAGDTPFDPVANALAYLKGLNNGGTRDKWLIILTDGVFNMYGDELFTVERLNSFNINEEIGKLGAQDIYIQYLSIDMPSSNPQKPAGTATFFVDEAQGAGIQDKLIEICNRIFQRDRLPNGDIEGATLHLGLSMRRLVVFVQGEGVEIEGLQDADGNKMAIASNSGQRKFSEYSVGFGKATKIDPAKIQTDTSLYGQVVTFENCSAGDYTLSVKGSVASDKVQVFYEPDVRIKAGLYLPGSDPAVDPPLDENDDNYMGERKLLCSIVDRKTGEDVSKSPLLGDQVYTITVTNGGKTYEVKNGDSITLVPDEGDNRTTIDVECAYLGGKYTIKNTDNPWSSARGGKQVLDLEPPPPAPPVPKLSVKIEGVSEYYLLSEHDKWKAVRVNVKLNGEKLTDEQLGALQVNIKSKNKEDPNVSSSSWKALPGESAVEIYLYKDANGVYIDGPETGKEKFTVECKLAGKDELPAPASWNQTDPVVYPWEVTADDSDELVFTTMNPLIKWIIRLAVAAAIIALVLWFMSRKVLPKDVKATQQVFKTTDAMMEGQGKASLDRKAKRIKVASPPANEAMNCRISFEVAPESRRWTRSKDRTYRIVRIFGAASTVEKIEINALGYVKTEKGFVSEDNPDMPLKINPRSTYTVTIFADEAQLECRIVNK